MPASVTLKALGLNTSPNQLEVPPGSLSEASNVVIRDNDVVSQRRGFAIYGENLGSSSDRASQLFSYQNRIIRYFGDTIEFDTGTQNTSGVEIFDAFDGSYSPAQEGLKTKSIESNGNLYFTSSNGILKISANDPSQFTSASVSDALTDAGIVTKAGGVKAVDLQASIIYAFGDQTGFLPADSTVAYRVLWLYNDANKNLIQGTPSQRAVVVNSLLTTTLQDYNFVLGALDNINQPGSLIDNGNYVATLGLPINASATDLYNAELLLASTLDDNLLYADQMSVAPLQISMGALVSGELVISFSSGDPSLYFIPGNNIELNGFTITDSTGHSDGSSTNGINGPQIAGSTFPTFTTTGDMTQGTPQITDVVCVADVSGSLAGTFWDISNANNIISYYVWYNVSGAGNDPSIAGKTGIRVNINTNDTANTVAANTTNSINSQFSIDFIAVNTGAPSAVIDITNTIDGSSLNADAGTSGFAVSTTQLGTAGNVLTSVADTSGVVNGSHITSGTSGIPSNTYVISTTFNTITLSNNVTNTASSVTLNFDAGLNINSSSVGTITATSATINDFTFESITSPIAPSNPATDAQLVGLQTYLSNIIISLQNLPSNVIPTPLLTEYISVLDVTNSVNVQLKITIPFNVTPYDFFQIYRSDIATATGTTPLSVLSPDDEDALVYEAFPTADQLASRSIIVDDITPDVFRGADLYTNEASGVGLAQAYDLPPFALDINRYKNVTFYANTKTLQRTLISLIGVVNMIRDYAIGFNEQSFGSASVSTIDDTITIPNHGFTATQSIEFHGVDLPSPLIESQTYYILNPTTNTFQVSLTKGGPPVDFTDSGSGSMTVYNQLPQIEITDGVTTNIYKFAVGFNEQTQVTTVAGSSLASSGTASYFFLNNANDATQYYIWYQIGTATDPLITGKTGIPVVALTADTADDIATKTNNTIATFIADFTTTISTNNVVITNTVAGATTHATAETSGFTITILTSGSGEDSATNTVLLANLVSVGQSVDETAQSLVRIINQNNNEIVNAYYLSSEGSVPGQIELESRNLSDQAFYLLANNTDTGQSFSPDISPTGFIISNTATNPTVVQTNIPHGMTNGDQVVIINSNSTPPINGLYNIKFIDSTHFSIPVVVTIAGNQGSWEKSTDVLFSDNEQKPNRIYYSVLQQPDAVPLVNFIDVGSQDQAIIRIMPLRDSLFVFKQDGLWRISGEIAPFTVQLFDSSCIVVAPDSVAVSNNMVFAWTTRGIVAVTEGGVNNISNNTINNIVKPLSSATFPAFPTATWGLGYESDNSYLVFTVVNPEDTAPQIAYRYDQITNTWTSYDKDYTCGVIHQFDDRMYAGAGDLNVIEQERKSFTRLDYADRELFLTLSPGQFFGQLMTFLTDVSPFNDGDVMVQTQYLTLYQFNQTLQKLDFDPALAGDYFMTIPANPGDNLRDDIIALAQKLDADPGTTFKDYFSGIDDQTGSIASISIANPTIITTFSPHNLQNNRIISISGSNSDPLVNDIYQVTVIDDFNFSIPVNVDLTVGTEGTFSTVSSDFRDIQACYNYLIANLNLDATVIFSNYQSSNGVTEQEAIIILVNTIKKQITVSLLLPFVQGPLSVFKAIDTSITYCPITFNDPLGLKQINEATMMFANKAFTNASLNFASDIIPSFFPVPFNGDGNGLFGYSGNGLGFGSNFMGGLSHGSPFRTIVPLLNQRCRYLIAQFQHGIAREMWQIYGLTLNGAIGQSTRTTR